MTHLNQTRKSPFAFAAFVALFAFNAAMAHPDKNDPESAYARYIANEGVLVVDGDVKILFDPLFQNSYGAYRTPTDKQRAAMMAGKAPYDDIDAVFISHAHGDHFTAEDVFEYLRAQPNVTLVAPQQAISAIVSLDGWDPELEGRLAPLALDYGDAARVFNVEGGVEVTAIRIPHAGWPQRAEIENIIYRVKLGENVVVMHLGDADTNDTHYAPYETDLSMVETDMGFAPFWFFGSPESISILKDRLRIRNAVGVHVPARVPDELAESDFDYFSTPDEVRLISRDETLE